MKALCCLMCFAGAAALAFAADTKSSSSKRPAAPKSIADVTVPERTAAQRHSAALYNHAAHTAAGIAYAKSRGASVDEFASFYGDQFVSGWNVNAGFVGLAAGAVRIQSLCRGEEDPPFEIVERTESMIRMKGVVRHIRIFDKGSVCGVTRDEFLRFWEVVWQRVAAPYGCTYHQEVTDGNVMIVTLTKGPAAAGGRTAAVP